MSIENYQVNGVGFNGTFNADIAGRTWTEATQPSGVATANWMDVSISDRGQYAVACVYGGKLYYSNTYGTNWTEATQPSGVTTANWIQVSMSSSGQYAVACVYGGKIYYSNTYGQSWIEATQPSGVTTTSWYSVSISGSGQYALACVNIGKLYYSNDYGQTWIVSTQPSGVSTTNWTSVTMSDSGQYAVACFYLGKLYYSNTYGTTWTEANQPVTSALWNNLSISESGQYAIASAEGTNGKLYYSNTYGQSWIVSTQPSGVATASWTSVSMSSSGQYSVACVMDGKIYYSSDYGQSWTVSTSSNAKWLNVSISGSGQYAIASFGNILNVGKLYYATNNNYYGNVMTGYANAGTNIGESVNLQTFSTVAGSITPSGYMTKILQYNTGDSWTLATQPSGVTSSNWNGFSMSASGQYAIASVNDSTGKMYYSSDYGKNWTASTMPLSITPYCYLLSMSASGQYAVACGFHLSQGRSFYSSDYGKTWRETSNAGTSVYIFAVAISGSGQYTIVGNYSGLLYYSSDYGVTRTASNAPSAEWRSAAMSASGQYAIASTTGTGTSTAYLRYSVDYGQTWVATGSAVPSFVVVSMSSSGQYALGCSNAPGRIYYSKDYGITWTQSTALQAVWQSCAMSGTGQYAIACDNTASTGKVYYSSNYGESWTAMSFTTTGRWHGIAISKSGQYAIGGIYGGQIYYSSNTSTTTVITDLADVFEPLYKYKTWTAVGTATGTWSGITCNLDGEYVVACSSGSGKTIYSSNYGDTWADANPAGDMRGVSMSNTGNYTHGVVYVNVTNAVVVTTNYGGNTWAYAGTNGNYMLSIATSSSGRYVIANRDAGSMLSGATFYSTGFGAAGAWASTTGLSVACHYIALSGNGKYGIACPVSTSGNGIYFSSNSGLSWTKSTSFTTTNFAGCAISADGEYAIAGASSSGKIQYSRTYGNTWIASNSASENWKGLSMSESGQYCVAACGNENIYYSNDYGVNWTSTTATTTAAADATTDIAISKNGQYAFVTTTSGKIWRCLATNVATEPPAYRYITYSASFGTSSQWFCLTTSFNGKYVMCATRGAKTISYSSDYGETWATSAALAGGAEMYSVAMSYDGKNAYCATCNTLGTFYKSTNFGVSWTALTSDADVTNKDIRVIATSGTGQYVIVGVFNSLIYYSSDYGVTFTATTTGSASTPWYSMSMSGNGKYAVACQYLTGTIFYSSNYGATWTASSPSTTWYSVSISGSGPYAVACSTTQIYMSSNYGETWTSKASVSTMRSVSISDTGKNIIACNETTVPRYSNDYGETWQTGTAVTGASFFNAILSKTGTRAYMCHFNGIIYKCIPVV